MKEGRGMEQYYSTEHALDSVISAADSNNAVSYSQVCFKNSILVKGNKCIIII